VSAGAHALVVSGARMACAGAHVCKWREEGPPRPVPGKTEGRQTGRQGLSELAKARSTQPPHHALRGAACMLAGPGSSAHLTAPPADHVTRSKGDVVPAGVGKRQGVVQDLIEHLERNKIISREKSMQAVSSTIHGAGRLLAASVCGHGGRLQGGECPKATGRQRQRSPGPGQGRESQLLNWLGVKLPSLP